MRVLVLLGGDSSERAVSLRSGKAVTDALVQAGHEVVQLDTKDGFGQIAGYAKAANCVFPILHGKNGEDGILQEHLETIGVAYLGTDAAHSKVAFDKDRAHAVLEKAAIAMPRHEVVDRSSFQESQLSKSPYVLKPIQGGSSVDTVIARTVKDEVNEQSLKLLEKHKTMLLEELIDGQEITVGVLGDVALPLTLILLPEGAEFDYENKYNGATQEICPVPTDVISEETQKRAQDMALLVHKTLGGRHLSRVDMFVKPDGSLVVLEMNTMPGMTEQSLFPAQSLAFGLTMPQLMDKLVDMTLKGK